MTRLAASSSTVARGRRPALAAVVAAMLMARPPSAQAAPPAGAGAALPPGVEAGSVAPLVDRVKGAVVTIQSTKFIRRFAVEDPWNRMLREQFGVPGPAPRAETGKQEGLGSGFIIDKSGI